jgi:hypothetical protein
MIYSTNKVSIFVCVNDMDLFNKCWRPSKWEHSVLSYFDNSTRNLSIPSVYNKFIKTTSAEILVFVHQDVICDISWLSKIDEQIAAIEKHDQSWGVLGIMGVRSNGTFAGNILDPHTSARYGNLPSPVLSLDEVCLIIRRNSGLTFDEQIGGFHFYGTDICLEARRLGLACYAIDARVRHLSGGRITKEFYEAADRLKKKWSLDKTTPLCIETTCGVFKLKEAIWTNIILRFMTIRRKINKIIQDRVYYPSTRRLL